jgi:hypothetical protein
MAVVVERGKQEDAKWLLGLFLGFAFLCLAGACAKNRATWNLLAFNCALLEAK